MLCVGRPRGLVGDWTCSHFGLCISSTWSVFDGSLASPFNLYGIESQFGILNLDIAYYHICPFLICPDFVLLIIIRFPDYIVTAFLVSVQILHINTSVPCPEFKTWHLVPWPLSAPDIFLTQSVPNSLYYRSYCAILLSARFYSVT